MILIILTTYNLDNSIYFSTFCTKTVHTVRVSLDDEYNNYWKHVEESIP